MNSVLVVDDDPIIVSNIIKGFEMERFAAEGTSDYRETIRIIESKHPDIVILDVFWGNSEDSFGIDVLREIREKWDKDALPVFMITAQGESAQLLESMNLGATDFISKPFTIAGLIERVKRTLEEGPVPPDADPLEPWSERIAGRSKPILDLTMNVWKAVRDKSDILILGETGTGKDLVARMYHQQSMWCQKPLKIIYCPNVSDTLFESQLFGHRKGAFTGANEDRAGDLREADGGIALLNEIGELTDIQQQKLLNFLETKRIKPLGSNEDIHLDVVVLAATNRPLKKMVDEGIFRNDLYQRLSKGVLLETPPLRKYLDDIPYLVEHIIQEINLTATSKIHDIDRDVIELFQQLYWDGNVRQLKNCIFEGARRCIGGKIILHDVAGYIERHCIKFLDEEKMLCLEDFNLQLDTAYPVFKQKLKDAEKKYLVHHLQKNNWQVPKTAESIGIKHRQRLNELMREFKIKKDQ
ncbi:sigma-54 dependent transcriptional regulator [bacterium]|nr:sigma-54 dependent transcriptional regulator [bacterium]